MIRDRGGLFRRADQIDPGIGVDHRKALRQGRSRNVGAANVQQPGHRLGLVRDIAGDTGGLQRGGDFGAFVGGGSAGQRLRIDGHRRVGRGRAVGPCGIDTVGHRHDVQPGQFAQPLDLSDAVQHRVEPHTSAVRQGTGQPVGQSRRGPVHRLENRGVGLRADLHGIPPIGEDRRPVAQHDDEPCGPGEAGNIGHPLVAGGDVFALMRVGAGHQESVEILRGHPCAQAGHAGRGGLGSGGDVEGLEHAGLRFGRSVGRQGAHRRTPAEYFQIGEAFQSRFPLSKYPRRRLRRGRAHQGQEARRIPITRALARGSLSNKAASCSVIAPASCSTSVIVTARS